MIVLLKTYYVKFVTVVSRNSDVPINLAFRSFEEYEQFITVSGATNIKRKLLGMYIDSDIGLDELKVLLSLCNLPASINWVKCEDRKNPRR